MSRKYIKSFYIGALCVFLCIFIFRAPLCFSQTKEGEQANKAIEKCRAELRTTTDPTRIAQAHLDIGSALETLGRETEATAEYLKIIINYPELEEINRKAEEKLANLYSGFSERSNQPVDQYRVMEGQKDPTIFFAYIKSLYENYRNLGRYEKSLHLLRRLYNIDPENQSYLTDMGNIYLHGLNDPDKAMFYFRKVIEMSPEHPSAYVDLGMAYEKKEDYANAIKSYEKALEISPVSQWSMYGLKRMEGIKYTTERRLVKDWYFLGSFDNSDRRGLEKIFPPEEGIDLSATYTGKSKKHIKWSRPYSYDDSGFVDLNMVFDQNDYAIAYALTYVYSSRDREAQFRLGSDDGIKVWLNDDLIFDYETTRSAGVDDDAIDVDLKKGWNKVLVKVSESWGSWGFYFRVTDPAGNPLDFLIFDPVKDDARVERIYKKFVREKGFRITKVAMAYTLTASAFLLSLYFMISNIASKIKINRMKEDFISSVSHELKTPIAAVKMLSETLKRGKIKGDVNKDHYYDMIIREADRLTRFINKILDFSKLEKDGKIFYFEKTNMVKLAKEAIDIFKDEAQDENLKISLNAEDEQIFAEADKDAMMQVILNLVDNACKYSKGKKEIVVNVKRARENTLLEVIDSGAGMPKEEIEKIFDKFYRINKDVMAGTKGSGLGLAFVKNVIQGHNGKIAVESELGKGSKFIISLPAERA